MYFGLHHHAELFSPFFIGPQFLDNKNGRVCGERSRKMQLESIDPFVMQISFLRCAVKLDHRL